MGLQPIRGTGKELKRILVFLREHYPGRWEVRKITECLGIDERKIVRLIDYARGKEWVTSNGQGSLRISSRCRLTSKGIDKLDSWTSNDDAVII